MMQSPAKFGLVSDGDSGKIRPKLIDLPASSFLLYMTSSHFNFAKR
jgi:hypothetical protein